MKKSNIILIGGTGRSGSNILKKVLSFHSEVYSLPFEHRFSIDPNGLVDFYNSIKYSWSPYNCNQKFNELEKFLTNISKKNIIKNFIGQFLKTLKVPRTLITSPAYFGWEMNKWFPEYDLHLNKLLTRLQTFRYKASWPGEKFAKINNEMIFVDPNTSLLADILNEFY